MQSSVVRMSSIWPFSGLLLTLFVVTSAIYGVCAKSSETVSNSDKTIVLFGGNGLIGAATAERLLREEYNLVLINRGNWYWDTAETIKPFVKLIQCDRSQALDRCSGLQHYLWSDDAPSTFEAVVDFSGYHSFAISEALNAIKGRIKRYIYISSDSTYEVCEKSHSGLTREEDAVRPEDPEEREAFALKDNYGHRKLEGEETLRRVHKTDGGPPHVSLRLPDVLGPRDNTYRWWLYQLWVALTDYVDLPLSIPAQFWDQKMSFVYVQDVADVIAYVIKAGPEVNNEAYNLAIDEQPTMHDVLHGIMERLNVKDIKITKDEDETPFYFFPSVLKGPMDTSKAKKMLKWKPTSWKDVLDNTIKFYQDAITNKKFRSPRNDVIRTMQGHFVKDPTSINRGLLKVYGVNLQKEHDEL